MKTSTLGVFVIAGTCLFAAGNVLAESGSGMTSQGLASEPAGIGERGTGQTQSTLERSGVPAQKGMASEPAGIGEKGTGQTQSTMERSGSPMPSGVGEEGTGQTQSTAERSGGQGSAQNQTSPTQSQSAMEHPER